jgi:hypothetical protein
MLQPERKICREGGREGGEGGRREREREGGAAGWLAHQDDEGRSDGRHEDERGGLTD